MYTKTDAKPVDSFWENDQRPEFYFGGGGGGLKVAPKLSFWGPCSPHI